MPKGVYAAASAMLQEQRSMDAVAQNMANAQSTGYRSAHALRRGFADVLADTQGRTNGIASDGGAGVTEAGIYRNFDEGKVQRTDNPLDVSLVGEGVFFQVEDPSGQTAVTRAGSFTLNADHQLVTPEGWRVMGQGAAVQFPAETEEVRIDTQGRITVRIDSAFQFVDQLRVVAVAAEDTQRLQPLNGQYFSVPDGVTTGDPGTIEMNQGFVEGSNVEPIEELVRMISLQRRFDAAQRSMTQQFDVNGISDLLRGVN